MSKLTIYEQNWSNFDMERSLFCLEHFDLLRLNQAIRLKLIKSMQINLEVRKISVSELHSTKYEIMNYNQIITSN